MLSMMAWANSNTSNSFNLPEDYEGQKWASAIKLSADGKSLYASNRAHTLLL